MIVKIKSSQGAMHKQGSDEAPDKIVECLKQIYANENGWIINEEIKEIEINKNNIEETNDNIEQFSEKHDAIFLGGDHSITYPLFKGFAKRNKNAGLVIFDAHPDCVNNFTPPTHEDFVKVLVAEGIVQPQNIILVGLRNWHRKEIEFLKEKKIKYFTMKQLFNDLNEVGSSIMELAREFESLYLSIDIDVIDPAFAPGTGHCEPGGLTSREFLSFIQRFKLLKNLKSVDIVEVNPSKDVNDMTSKLAAKIINELK
ncbi:MAG: arginase family protein [archaeon]